MTSGALDWIPAEVDQRAVREAAYWEPYKGRVRCTLCPHNCVISEGKAGICTIRAVHEGRLYTLVWGTPAAINLDPIEKKPLFHFHPTSRVLSFGSVGCNFKCLHCQNHSISQHRPGDRETAFVPPEEVPAMLRKSGAKGVAYTYNEPSIWFEYILACYQQVKAAGGYTTMVSNGYINAAPLAELAPVLDAANYDVKAGTLDFYKKVSKGRLDPVLQTVERAVDLGIYVELTYLIIPTHNDDPKEFTQTAQWVLDKLGPDVPLHFSAFHPDYQMQDIPPTPPTTVVAACDAAKEVGLHYVYGGNVDHGEYENTRCPRCNTLLIERHWFDTTVRKLDLGKGQCGSCGLTIPGIWR